MRIIYRISDAGYNKVKPNYINNENCLVNALEVFSNQEWLIIADNCSQDTLDMIFSHYSGEIKICSVGHGAGTFNMALDYAMHLPDSEVVYFLENDYLHLSNSHKAIYDALLLGADYVTLYDHPDKYMRREQGGNPFVQEDNAEQTKVYLGKNNHWKLTNSTTMTFAARVSTLKKDEALIRKYTSGTHPNDFEMFTELIQFNKLFSPIPSYATHGETQWLSPLVNWENTLKTQKQWTYKN
jgi:hypothetical protein